LAEDDLLQALASEIFVPLIEGQEPLQVSGRDSSRQGDRLAAFLAEVRQLPADVRSEMRPRIASSEAIIELVQIPCEHRFQLTNLVGVHAKPSLLERNGDRLPQFASLCNTNIAQ
jgi:hypothetical protein